MFNFFKSLFKELFCRHKNKTEIENTNEFVCNDCGKHIYEFKKYLNKLDETFLPPPIQIIGICAYACSCIRCY